MFTTVAPLWTILRIRFLNKKSTYSISSQITLNNCIPFETKGYLRETISIGHCRGH